MIANARQTMAMQQEQQQIQQVNALRNVLGAPGAIDKTGNPTSETLSKVMSIDPNVGLKLGQNQLVNQQRQMQMDSLRTRAVVEKADMLNGTYAPILEAYERALQPGSNTSPEQAAAAAQKATTEATERLLKSGTISPEEAQRLPTKFDPNEFRQRAMGYSQYQNWLKEQRIDKENKIRDDRVGTTAMTDSDNRPFILRPNASGPKATYLDGTPVPEDKLTGAHKTGTGRVPMGAKTREAILADIKTEHPDWTEGQANLEAIRREREAAQKAKPEDPSKGWEILTDPTTNEQYQHQKGTGKSLTLNGEPYTPGGAQRLGGPPSAANQDRDATKQIVTQGYETELGRPVDPKNKTEVAELNRRIQAAEDRRKVQLTGDKAGAATRGRQDAENQGVPETPEAKASLAAQASTGQPLNQIVMGYGKSAVQARKEAREGAIEKIMADTGMTAEQAGVELAMRGIEYATGKRSDQQLGTIRGATVAAVKQLDYNVDQVLEDFKKLPGSDLSPIINALVRGEQRWTGDPAYSQLFFHMQAVANESARILSGGQASIAQLAEGARKEAEKWAGVNMTPASFKAVAQSMHEEGQARIRSFDEARKEQRLGEPKKPDAGAAAPAAKTWPTPVPTSVDRLRQNPAMAPQFDEAYGPGAAQRALGTAAPTPLAPSRPVGAEPNEPARTPPTVPARPETVPAGSAYSPSRQMWRAPDGRLYNAQGKPAAGR
ncbi:MAG TPA: hypothetical protein VNU68_35115 [Verrucomicrobiae bacterium]|nr:hypothetical protein [Verrucomicrobiae bacterium]